MGQLSMALRRSSGALVNAPSRGGAMNDPLVTRSANEGDAAARGLLAGLDSIGRAAALVDRAGNIVAANALARPFVGLLAGPSLACPAGRSRSVHQRIRDVLDGAARGDDRERVTVLALPDGGMLVVRATAIGLAEPDLFRRAGVLVQFAKLGLDLVPDPAFCARRSG